MAIALKFTDAHTQVPFDLYQNRPNPFKRSTMISYQLPDNSDVRLILRNEAGSVLQVIKEEGKAGYNTIDLKDIDLPRGFIYYQLTTKFGTKAKKMIRLE